LGYPTYNYLNERFHSYGYARPLCSLSQSGCSVANALPGFRCNAGPGQPGCAQPGTKNVWPLLFNSHIVQEMSGDKALAVNLTMPDHLMRDGIVVRWLGEQGGYLMSYTYGEGVNTSVFRRDANQLAGWALFKMADMQLQQQLELKIRETPQK